MPGLVFLMLPLMVLLVFMLMAVALIDVAFREVPVNSGIQARNRVLKLGSQSPVWEIASKVQQLAGDSRRSPLPGCACDSFVPLVTEPEAKAIADELRACGGRELKLVAERSKRHGASCPMLTETGLCACAMTRPLACIGRCVVGGDSPEWAKGIGETVSEAFRHHLETRHVNSETRRLDDALVSLL